MCFLVAWVGFVWMLSSSGQVALECIVEFSLFHEQFQCRLPQLAIVVWVTSGLLSLWLARKGLKDLWGTKSNDKGKQ